MKSEHRETEKQRLTEEGYNELTRKVVGAAIEVHGELCSGSRGATSVISALGRQTLRLINFNVPVLKDGIKRIINGRLTISV